MKKFLHLIFIIFVIAGLAGILGFGIYGTINSATTPKTGELAPLPLPEKTGGVRGQLGIDQNVNETTIDDYLGRSDSVYRDMRMLVDEADYAQIGGDSYLSGFVEGFEVVPYPKLVNVTGLPAEVGQSYVGPTLFTQSLQGIKANYAESLDFLEYYFPKDKNIFLMCGGGGYAGMTKELLTTLGWDENRIWVVGGYWYYHGTHAVQVKRQVAGENVYDFWKVPYHDIDFTNLHEK